MFQRFAPWALLLALGAAPASAQDAPRKAEAILKDIDAIKPPELDQSKREDQAYVQSYIAEMMKARQKRAELALELLKADPKNPKLPPLLIERWQTGAVQGEALTKEIDDAAAKTGDASLKAEGMFFQAVIKLQQGADPKDVLKAVEAFAAAAKKGERRVAMLFGAVAERTKDLDEKTALEDRILKDFPEAGDEIRAARKLRAAVGKPFELEFTDAVSGKSIRMADLKGKVVVVDFWATWCGPCIAEMPNMKKLYAEFKPKGVEFLGISLDQPEDEGGLKALKEYVAKNEITWPQYYQGKGWESEFSKSWGINGIPALFVVDTEGNLASTEARGKLEEMIPALLAKKGGTKGE